MAKPPRTSEQERKLGHLIGRRLKFEAGRTICFYHLAPSPPRDPKTHPPHTKPDFLFRRGMVAVFFDGCYWHECPEHYPNSFGGVARTRDERNNAELARMGWLVLRTWEHESDLRVFADHVIEQVRERRLDPGRVDHGWPWRPAAPATVPAERG